MIPENKNQDAWIWANSIKARRGPVFWSKKTSLCDDLCERYQGFCLYKSENWWTEQLSENQVWNDRFEERQMIFEYENNSIVLEKSESGSEPEWSEKSGSENWWSEKSE